MFKRPILTIMFAAVTFIVTLIIGIAFHPNMQASFFDSKPTFISGMIFDPLFREETEQKYGEWSYCQYAAPEQPIYEVDLLSVEMDEDIEPDEVFLVTMTFVNKGNTRLFASDSGCDDMVGIFNVGTQKVMDRASILGDSAHAISGWTSPGRIKMSEPYADPNEEFQVAFQSLAPEGNNIYREFFQPVVENVSWIDETFAFDVEVGEPSESMRQNIRFVSDVSLAASQLEGLSRNLEITLEDQKMYARFGDLRVWNMTISSGHWETPTPRGNYKILSKQELRIGGQWPHYRMPYFQMWRSDGYGIHALPYLESDGGVFWSEALDHIGTPVSHGCIRTLPEDAITAYEFTSIGTPLWIH